MSSCTAARHGDLTAYWQDDCRCPRACQLAGRRQKEYRTGRRRLLPAIGTTRRVQALASIGWRCSDLASRLGVTHEAVAQLARGRTLVREGTAARVARLYAELCDTPGPSTDVARRSAAKGWLPPKWWDADTIDDPTYEPPTQQDVHWSDLDPVAVERACDGDQVRLTRAERTQAVRTLRQQGLSLNQIAQRLHIDQRQVSRDLDEHLEQAS